MSGARHLLLALALASVTGCGSGESGAQPRAGQSGQPAVAVRLATVAADPVEQYTEYVATLRSRQTVPLRPQVDGRIERIQVKPGERVREGRPLLKLADAEQRALVRSLEAQLAASRADLAYAEEEAQRYQALVEQGIVSRQQYERARATLESTRADVMSLEARVREARARLAYHTVNAPVAGVVGDIPVRQGQYVTSDTVLTTVAQNAALEVFIQVPVEVAGALSPGTPVTLVDPAGTRLADTKISFISPEVDDGTQSVLATALLENPGNLRTDQFVRARVVWDVNRSPTVPVIAVTRLNGQPFVFVAEERDGALVARQRPVTLGRIVGNVYPVAKGLAPGDRVVVSGIQKLADGVPIQPAPEA
jgi:RND family efflux transporter MFP subunit